MTLTLPMERIVCSCLWRATKISLYRGMEWVIKHLKIFLNSKHNFNNNSSSNNSNTSIHLHSLIPCLCNNCNSSILAMVWRVCNCLTKISLRWQWSLRSQAFTIHNCTANSKLSNSTINSNSSYNNSNNWWVI
jgi:hypothetical protein